MPRICAVPVLTALLVAQSPCQDRQQVAPSEVLTPPAALLAGVVPIHTGTGEPGVPYGIWGAVEPYFKASFHGDMTFIPYLGEGYPQNQPWSWRTVAVTVGSEVLVQDGDMPERVRASDTRYEYRFGAVTEAYDLRGSGLEQTFAIPRRPSGRGDLVVRGRVATQLEAATAASAHQELVFHDQAGAEIVGYGAAFALDAGGRKIPIATAIDDNRISLTVPATFLEEATYPVTIDPLLTRRSIAYSDPVLQVDVCRDDDLNEVMFAYTRAASLANVDAFARIANDALTTSTSVFADINSVWDNWRISCATAALPARYCLVLSRDSGPYGGSSVRYQVRRSGNTNFVSRVYSIPRPPDCDFWNPDVGGTVRHPGGSHVLIAWQKILRASPDAAEIWAVPVDVTPVTQIVAGGVLGTPVQLPKRSSGGDAEYPSVNQVAVPTGGRTTWVVCWQEWSNLLLETDWDIVARQVDQSGNVSSGALVLGATRQKLGPQVAGTGDRYAVAYAAGSTAQMPGKVVTTRGHGVDLTRFDWPAGSSLIWVKPTVRILDSARYADRRWLVGGISQDHSTSSHWAYTLHSNATGVSYVGRVGFGGHVTEGPMVTIDGPPSSTTVAAAITFDDDQDRWVLGWGKGADVRGNHFVYRTPGPIGLSGLSCGPATIAWTGVGANQQIGCEFSGVRLSGMVSNSVSLIAVGFRPVVIPLPIPPFGSSCNQYVDVLATSGIAIGASSDFRLPLLESLSPADVYFQGFYTNSSMTRFYNTQRLKVPIIK